MARADLHNAFAVDREIFEAAQVDAGLMDPVVRVPSGLPGEARPFVVLREYQGPVGYYTERFELIDSHGAVVHRSAVQRIKLTGEMFEDRVLTDIRQLVLDDHHEHRLRCYIDDEEVGEVPVFLESGMGGDPSLAIEETFKKAVGKGDILWLTVPSKGGRKAPKPVTQAVWFLTQGTTVYVLTGPGEQDVAGLTSASEVDITVRSKDLRSRVARVTADARILPKDDPEWLKLANAGTPKRLNLPDKTYEDAVQRWLETCEIVELTPRFGQKAA